MKIKTSAYCTLLFVVSYYYFILNYSTFICKEKKASRINNKVIMKKKTLSL